MFENYGGKLLVYAPSGEVHKSRLTSVSVAAEKMAKLLNLNMEVVTLKERFTPIYVYYKNGEEEPVPIYCDKGEEVSMMKIHEALRNMMFVLSFHPKHSALKRFREEIMRFS